MHIINEYQLPLAREKPERKILVGNHCECRQNDMHVKETGCQ